MHATTEGGKRITRFTYSDPALQCIDCGFATYSENNALGHEIETGHSLYDSSVTW